MQASVGNKLEQLMKLKDKRMCTLSCDPHCTVVVFLLCFHWSDHEEPSESNLIDCGLDILLDLEFVLMEAEVPADSAGADAALSHPSILGQ